MKKIIVAIIFIILLNSVNAEIYKNKVYEEINVGLQSHKNRIVFREVDSELYVKESSGDDGNNFFKVAVKEYIHLIETNLNRHPQDVFVVVSQSFNINHTEKRLQSLLKVNAVSIRTRITNNLDKTFTYLLNITDRLNVLPSIEQEFTIKIPENHTYENSQEAIKIRTQPKSKIKFTLLASISLLLAVLWSYKYDTEMTKKLFNSIG